jgi:hypothetical protein
VEIPLPPGYQPPAYNKIVPSTCSQCQGSVNVLLSGWTPDGPPQENPWTCPRCQAANTIVVPGTRVGIAHLTVESHPAPPHGLMSALRFERAEYRAIVALVYIGIAVVVIYGIVRLLS